MMVTLRILKFDMSIIYSMVRLRRPLMVVELCGEFNALDESIHVLDDFRQSE